MIKEHTIPYAANRQETLELGYSNLVAKNPSSTADVYLTQQDNSCRTNPDHLRRYHLRKGGEATKASTQAPKRYTVSCYAALIASQILVGTHPEFY